MDYTMGYVNSMRARRFFVHRIYTIHLLLGKGGTKKLRGVPFREVSLIHFWGVPSMRICARVIYYLMRISNTKQHPQ